MKTSECLFVEPRRARSGFRARKVSSSLRILILAVTAGFVLQWNLSFKAGATPLPDGSLDPSFGAGGKVTSSFSKGDQITAIALQQDGKIVAGGEATDNMGHTLFVLARYNVNGGLDMSFGTAGNVITSVNGIDDEIHAVAIQADGRIVVAGSTKTGPDFIFALARYNSNGTLDAGFGAGGIVTTGLNGRDFANGLAVQQDGKIVAGGSSAGFFALARYNSNGSLDGSFGAGGKATIAFTVPFTGGAGARGMALQSDGKIVAAGSLANQQLGSVFALARFNVNGTLDSGFGTGGKVTTSFAMQDFANGVAIQSDGKIVAAGQVPGQMGEAFALARYNSNGTLDTGFGSGGKVTTSFSGDAFASGVAIQSDSKIVVAGSMNPPNTQNEVFALARYNTNGSLDSGFGTGGEVTTSFGNVDGAQAVAIQPDGRIVAAGFSDLNFALARYNSTLITFDTCLGNPSSGIALHWNSRTGDYSLASVIVSVNSVSLTGRGTVRQTGSILTLTDFKPDRRISAYWSTNQLTGRATIYIRVAPGVWQQYIMTGDCSSF